MHYRRLRALGSGATATTYLAQDLRRGDQEVAQKLFSRDWSDRNREKIDAEFGLLSRLSHPYLVRVQDFGLFEDQCFLITDFVSGKPLLQHLQGRSENTVYWHFAQLLEALDYLAFRNVVHLDLKPENILVETEGPEGFDPAVKLLDFGLAAMALDPEGPGQAIGSPPYTAPEFARHRKWDLRSDLYSVGVLLYQALSGQSPFPGDDPLEILNRQWNETPVPLEHFRPEVSPKMAAFVHRLLAADPEARPPTPRRALEELRNILGGSLGTSPLWTYSLFEDPDWNFREKAFDSLLQKMLASPGRFGIRGSEGSGKTFGLRWIQRQLWRKKIPVVLIKGEELLLSDPERFSPETFLLIDNADRGPWQSWMEHAKFRSVLLSFSLEALPPQNGDLFLMELAPLSPQEMAGLKITLLKTKIAPELIPEETGEAVWPGILIREAWGRMRRATLGSNPKAPDLAEILLPYLEHSHISLDLQTLSAWAGASVRETQTVLEQLVQKRRLLRECREGGVWYRSLDPDPGSDGDLSPEALDSLLEKCLEMGHFEVGLHLFDQSYEKPLSGEAKLLRAEFLAGAQRYGEVLKTLHDKFLKSLTSKQRTKARELLGKTQLFTGDLDPAQAHLERALRDYEGAKDSEGAARVYLHLGILAQRRGKIPEAEQYYKQVLQLGPGTTMADLLRGVGYLNWGNLFYDRGEYTEAQPRYEKALQLLTASGHGPVTAQAHLNFAHLQFYLGETFAAESHCRDAIRLAIQSRYPLTQGYALLLLALLDQERGNPKRQGLRLAEAVELFSKTDLVFEWIQAKINQAYYFDDQGRGETAEASAREALKRSLELNSPALTAKSKLILGKVLRNNPQSLPEAAKTLQEALKYFDRVKNEEVQWQVEFELGEVERRKGNREAALHLFDQSEKTLESLLSKLPPNLQESYLRDKKRQLVGGAKKLLKKVKNS